MGIYRIHSLNGRELRASRLPAYPSNQTELPNFPTVSKVVDNFLTSGLFIGQLPANVLDADPATRGA